MLWTLIQSLTLVNRNIYISKRFSFDVTNASKQLSFFLSRGDSLLVGGGSGGYPRSNRVRKGHPTTPTLRLKLRNIKVRSRSHYHLIGKKHHFVK